MRRITVSIMAGAMLFGAGITSQASTVTVETVSAWDGVNHVFNFGEPDTATYGQTFRTPDATHTVLDDFTFYLEEIQGTPVQFGAYVYAWDSVNNRAAGPNLFQSGMLATTGNGGAGGFEAITVTTGGISLDSGVDYVAFFSASEFFAGSAANQARFGLTPAASYSDGEFVFINNGADTSLWTTEEWFPSWGGDLAFEMNFSNGLSVIPLPPAAAMGFLMMGLLGAVRHRRRTH